MIKKIFASYPLSMTKVHLLQIKLLTYSILFRVSSFFDTNPFVFVEYILLYTDMGCASYFRYYGSFTNVISWFDIFFIQAACIQNHVNILKMRSIGFTISESLRFIIGSSGRYFNTMSLKFCLMTKSSSLKCFSRSDKRSMI